MHGHISIKHKSQWIIIMHSTISNRYSDSHYLYLHHHRNCIQYIQRYLCFYNGAHHGRYRRWSMTRGRHNNHNELLNIALLMHIHTLLTVTRPGVHQQEVGRSQVIAMIDTMTIQNDED